MKRLLLLPALFMASVASRATVVQGLILNGSNLPVAGETVYVADSTVGGPVFTLSGVTNASGNYSITLPANIPNSLTLAVYTSACNAFYVHAVSYIGVDVTSNFNVCPVAPTPKTVSGYVSKGSANGFGACPASVYFIKKYVDNLTNSLTLKVVDSTSTDSLGHYSYTFGGTVPDTLLVKAALKFTATGYANYLPSYYTSSLNWSGATAVAQPLPANNVNIVLVAGTNPGGPGFIGGSVLQGANRTTNVGDPLPQRILLLTDVNNNAVAYTYSDASGYFSFPSLAYGTYNLFGDAMGLLNPPLSVTISASSPSIGNVVFLQNATQFKGHIQTTGVSGIASVNKFNIYPNPVKDNFSIANLDKVKGTKEVTLTGLNGAVIYETSVSETATTIAVPTQNLAAGIYLLNVATVEGKMIYKIIK